MQDSLDALRIDGDAKVAPRRSGRRRRLWPWILAALLVGAGVFWLAKPRVHTLSLAPVVQAYPSRAITVLTASGYVVAQRKASLAAKVTSQLAWLGVEEGSRVHKGQVVARLEHADLDAARSEAAHQLAAAAAQVDQAEAELTDATLNYKRMGFSRGGILLAFLLESLLLGGLGGLAGVGLAALLGFVTFSTINFQTFSELAFRFALTPKIVLLALAFSLTMVR